jgi:ectoine hydroxylase-related dioxygenase (phytanoyl-CoA dioxygenase family)
MGRAAVCEAWLGPGYQITGTTNATFVGGDQQDIHRDYREYTTPQKRRLQTPRRQPSING